LQPPPEDGVFESLVDALGHEKLNDDLILLCENRFMKCFRTPLSSSLDTFSEITLYTEDLHPNELWCFVFLDSQLFVLFTSHTAIAYLSDISFYLRITLLLIGATSVGKYNM